MAIKNLTQWVNNNGAGFTTFIGLLNLQDNSGHLFVDNSGHYIVSNPVQYTGKYLTTWSQSGV